MRKTTPQVLLLGATIPVAGIARQVLPAKSKRALNKFHTEYDWDKE